MSFKLRINFLCKCKFLCYICFCSCRDIENNRGNFSIRYWFIVWSDLTWRYWFVPKKSGCPMSNIPVSVISHLNTHSSWHLVQGFFLRKNASFCLPKIMKEINMVNTKAVMILKCISRIHFRSTVFVPNFHGKECRSFKEIHMLLYQTIF